MATPTAPTLHLNGSGYQNLMDDYREMYQSLTLAIRAIQAHGPNQRDYYITPGAWEKVRAEHALRLDTLNVMRADILLITNDIQEQHNEREKHRR